MLKQICQHIPAHLVPKLAGAFGADKGKIHNEKKSCGFPGAGEVILFDFLSMMSYTAYEQEKMGDAY